jgi:altronate hydrolase
MIQIHPSDNVGVVTQQTGNIPPGHKVALCDISAGSDIIKYGCPIGHAARDIKSGEWVHTHNIETNLAEKTECVYLEDFPPQPSNSPATSETFLGYIREDGRVGIRNEIWVLPTVGCVNDVARRLAEKSSAFAFEHPYGCSQTDEDHEATRSILALLASHPNAGGVLIVGLGCENNTMEQFKEALGDYDEKRIRFMVCQDETDEIETGLHLLSELKAYVDTFKRQVVPVSSLVIGMKCGGSDGFSGITANPCVGALCDMLTERGGSVILTEVPEMFGAESVLTKRAANRAVFDSAIQMIDDYKEYFTKHGQTVYENPSPGNKQGGISTLEDKSLGCVQKGGTRSSINGVIPYGGRVKESGLNLLYGPGNDLVSATALAAAGAQMILFTTGRGTPFSGPVPTLKISSNTALFQAKSNWIDFDAGTIIDSETIPETAERLWNLVLEIASGNSQTKAEQNGYRGIAIFKNGVTL